ncbi:hypothetical protein SEA_AGLET_44 [Mycobacterium phage Aglet]|nr:hypothetical protein SEA_AGLET_44 [Mycobacterium phage Aglet]
MAEPLLLIEKRDDGQYWVQWQGEDWGLLTCPQFDYRMDSYSTECEVSFRMIHRPKSAPKPKRTWSRAMGLRKPTRKEHP